MNPEIFSPEEILLIESLLDRFRSFISDDELLYGFSLQEFDEVAQKFPDVDLIDEGANTVDHTQVVLNNMFAFTLDKNPKDLLSEKEAHQIETMWRKLRNV